MALPFSSIECDRLPNDLDCDECGWKCSCYKCTENTSWEKFECQCPCRFWVVACFTVLLGFFIVFYVAAVMRRALLYTMSSGAVLASAALSAVSVTTENCGWPAFLSVALVFAFPCAYSCCWQCNEQRNLRRSSEGEAARGNGASGGEAKMSNAVVMVFPGGEVQLGITTEEELEGKEGGRGKKKRKKKQQRSLSTASVELGDLQSGGNNQGAPEEDVELGQEGVMPSTS